MPAERDPIAILDAARRAALGYAHQTSATQVTVLMKRAHADLLTRLKEVPATDGSFTALQMRSTLKQIEAVIRMTKTQLLGTVVTAADVVGNSSTAATLRYIREAEKKYAGVGGAGLGINTAKVFDAAVSGTSTSVLRRIASDPAKPGHKGVMDRYGDEVIGHFERTLQTSVVAGTPWEDVKSQLVSGSTFLQSVPEHWAERIVRTELMGAHNTAAYLATQEIHDQTGGTLIRILCATFDDRTGSDSYAVHGQIRRMDEPFASWFGSYMTPPNRPNDREVVVPHNIEWKIPENLRPKSDSDVAARWRQEKRKGSPPPRPLMSTVVADTIGKPAGPPPLTAASAMQTKVSEATGSNPGGVYRGADGTDRYVKLYSDPSQAAGEHLSNQLYSDLGQASVKSHVLTRDDGAPIYASEMMPDVMQLGKIPGGVTPELARKALDGFVGDLLTANWDASGLNMDNMVVTLDQRVVRIDNGGTFLMRAKAGRKPKGVLNDLTEWDGLFDPKINPTYSALAKIADVHSAADMLPQIREQLNRVKVLVSKAGGWKSYIDQHAPALNATDSKAIVDMLSTREALIEQRLLKAEAEATSKSEAAAAKKLKAAESAKKAAATKAAKKAKAATDAINAAVAKALSKTTDVGTWTGALNLKKAATAVTESIPSISGKSAPKANLVPTVAAPAVTSPVGPLSTLAANADLAAKKAALAVETLKSQIYQAKISKPSDVGALQIKLDAAQQTAADAAMKAKAAKAKSQAFESPPVVTNEASIRPDVVGKQSPVAHLPVETLPRTPNIAPGGVMEDHKVRDLARAQLTPHLKDSDSHAIHAYTGTSYSDVRAARIMTREAYNNRRHILMEYDEALAMADRLDSIVQRRHADQNPNRVEKQFKEIYRGMKQLSAEDFESIVNSKTIDFKAPTSMAWNPNVSINTFYGTGRSVLFRITPAATSQGVAIQAHSEAPTESEILFGTGAKFKVTKVVRDAHKDDGAIVYMTEIGGSGMSAKGATVPAAKKSRSKKVA
jgi:hypothetical protein